MTIRSTSATLAATAAMLALSACAVAGTPPKGSTGASVAASDKVHCYGVNSCKGQAECKTAANDCKGLNSCKAQGFKAATAKACLEQGGTIGDLVAQ
jgi:hypothetical protein